jgi:cysteine-rich repeat protein
MKFRLHALLLDAVLLGAFCDIGCSGTKDSYIVVHSDVDCNVPRVFQMSVTISNGTKADRKFVPESQSTELGFPSDFTFIVPSSRTGSVQISVDALDQNGSVIGQGSTSGQIKVGARIDLNVQLSVLPAVCGNGVVETGEACDDGNRISGDGCSSNCQVEVVTPLDDGGVPGGVDGGANGDSRASTSRAPFLQVSTGGGHSCAVRTDSTLWCWGDNKFGQLHFNDTTNRLTPVSVGDTAWNRISCGGSHSCSLRTDGSLSCWGNNNSGQLGNPAIPASGSPTEVAGGPWQSISAGSYQTCGIKYDGTLWCWGDNANGQLGNGSLDDSLSPTQVTDAGSGIVFSHVSSNYLHTCATVSDGSLWCWGLNSNAQIGDLNGSYHTSPVQLDGAGWADVYTGLYHSCALKSDGTLWCWGGNEYGQLGSASVPTGKGSQSVVAVQLDGSNWKSASSGELHTCAIRTDDSLWCWGDNSYGQLGTGDTNSINAPVNIVATSGTTWSTVATGSNHTCAVATDGWLWCWGANTSGQLGIGNTEQRSSPTKVVQ